MLTFDTTARSISCFRPNWLNECRLLYHKYTSTALLEASDIFKNISTPTLQHPGHMKETHLWLIVVSNNVPVSAGWGIRPLALQKQTEKERTSGEDRIAGKDFRKGLQERISTNRIQTLVDTKHILTPRDTKNKQETHDALSRHNKLRHNPTHSCARK